MGVSGQLGLEKGEGRAPSAFPCAALGPRHTGRQSSASAGLIWAPACVGKPASQEQASGAEPLLTYLLRRFVAVCGDATENAVLTRAPLAANCGGMLQ